MRHGNFMRVGMLRVTGMDVTSVPEIHPGNGSCLHGAYAKHPKSLSAGDKRVGVNVSNNSNVTN
jgi:hypothetical protein